MIRNTVLPNPQTYSAPEIAKWHEAELRVKPFQVILSVMDKLGRAFGLNEAYLTPNELIRVVIPLSGAKSPVDEMMEAVRSLRKGELDVSAWPNCAPAANDKRLAREFLLFLDNFGICQRDDAADRYEQKFQIDQVFSSEVEINDAPSFLEEGALIENEMVTSRNSEIPIIIERKRVNTSVIRRTNQSKFRKDMLHSAGAQCLITKEKTPDVLEAAHIIPVGHGGSDEVGNGFCMRVDIHRLFDGGKIRILPDGKVQLNDHIKDAVSYSALPMEIKFPDKVAIQNVEWRSRYL